MKLIPKSSEKHGFGARGKSGGPRGKSGDRMRTLRHLRVETHRGERPTEQLAKSTHAAETDDP